MLAQFCYLQPRVAGQRGRLVVDGFDGDRHGDWKAAALDLVGRGGEREAVLCGLAAVVHVHDMSQFHLRGDTHRQQHVRTPSYTLLDLK